MASFGPGSTLRMVRVTLEGMARGGHVRPARRGLPSLLGGREVARAPLREDALRQRPLATVYLHAFQATGDGFFRRIATETLDYVLREMTAPEGGFYSAQDADSEGEEGKFFVWAPDEVTSLLGAEDARLFNATFDVTPEGNFEGHSILHLERPLEEVARSLDVPLADLEAALERGSGRSSRAGSSGSSRGGTRRCSRPGTG